MSDDVTVHHGKCEDVLPGLPDASFDACVTDPPYDLTSVSRNGSPRTNDPATPHGRTRLGERGGFMGKTWDGTGVAFKPETWALVLRLLKPGGHLLAFGGSRTFHRLACAIEDAGFEIRDTISWLYGSGFAKSWNFDTQFTGEWCGCNPLPYSHAGNTDMHRVRDGVHAPTEPRGEDQGTYLFAEMQRGEPGPGLGEARQQGPSGVVAGDGASVPAEDHGRGQPLLAGRELHRRQGLPPGEDAESSEGAAERLRVGARAGGGADAGTATQTGRGSAPQEPGTGRQPAGEPEDVREPLRALDDRALRDGGRCTRCGGLSQEFRGHGSALKPGWEPVIVARKPLAGTLAASVLAHGTGALNIDGCRVGGEVPATVQGQSQNAGDIYGADQRTLREFVPNDAGRWPANVVLDEDAAAQLDRQSGERPSGSRAEGVRKGLGYHGANGDGGPAIDGSTGGASRFYYTAKAAPDERPRVNGIAHPTVKPLDLMRWLVRLVTPPGGLVLDPFAGSGTTGEACIVEGFRCVLIEREADYLPLIEARLSKPIQPTLGATP